MSDIADDDLTPEDEQLLARLGGAIEDTGTVPPWLTRFANESQRLIALDAELAEIASDSLIAETAGTRSTGGLRTIEFAVDAVRIRLEIEGNTIRGSIEPQATAVTLATTEGQGSVEVNSRGFFTFAAPTDQFRLVVDVDDRRIKTDWINLR